MSFPASRTLSSFAKIRYVSEINNLLDFLNTEPTGHEDQRPSPSCSRALYR